MFLQVIPKRKLKPDNEIRVIHNSKTWYMSASIGSVNVKINPHVLPTQTAWQIRRKHNIFYTSWLCRAHLQTVIPNQTAVRKICTSCKTRLLQITNYWYRLPDAADVFSALKLDFDQRRSSAMQVATKVITSWLPSITSPHYSAHWGGAVEVKNTSRALTLAPQSSSWGQKHLLPALMSRSSWFACPSCCEVAMFPLAADSHWLLTELHWKLLVQITPPLIGNLLEFNGTHHRHTGVSLRHQYRKSFLCPPSLA